MTAEEIIRKTRVSPLDDNKAPYLWEDVELVDYLNDAINDIMRSTEILRDRTPIPQSPRSAFSPIWGSMRSAIP